MITFLYFLPILLYLFLKNKKNEERAKRKFIYIMTFVLCLLCALRNHAVGIDTYAYYLGFEESNLQTWSEIVQEVKNYYNGNHINSVEKDIGYVVISKTLSSVWNNFGSFQFFAALVLLSAIGRIIYMGVKPMWGYTLSYTYYLFLFYNYLPNSATRQTIAMGIMLWGIILWIEQSTKKRLILASIMILIASTIHKSSLAGFIPLIIGLINKPKPIYLFAIIGCPTMFFIGRPIAHLLAELSQINDYMIYATRSFYDNAEKPILFIVIMIFFYFIGLLNIKKIDTADPLIRFSYSTFAVAVITISFIHVDPTLIRLIAYFSIWGIVYLPNAIDNLFRKDIKTFLCCFILLLFIVRAIYNPTPYRFYWQEMQLHERYGM